MSGNTHKKKNLTWKWVLDHSHNLMCLTDFLDLLVRWFHHPNVHESHLSVDVV